ncbi:uncharacterized protein [Drosophila takahashii]|uniref:uncharacterized protein n=1 Tax=Drosophila takahashii TaxID=29030 RepID=UPI003898D7B1
MTKSTLSNFDLVEVWESRVSFYLAEIHLSSPAIIPLTSRCISTAIKNSQGHQGIIRKLQRLFFLRDSGLRIFSYVGDTSEEKGYPFTSSRLLLLCLDRKSSSLLGLADVVDQEASSQDVFGYILGFRILNPKPQRSHPTVAVVGVSDCPLDRSPQEILGQPTCSLPL